MSHASRVRGALVAAAAAALLGANGAAAEILLVSSTPSADAEGPAPKAIVLTFSEKLAKRPSGGELSRDRAPLGSRSLLDEKAGKVLTITPNAPLSPGDYKLIWHVAAADGQTLKGILKFTVR